MLIGRPATMLLPRLTNDADHSLLGCADRLNRREEPLEIRYAHVVQMRARRKGLAAQALEQAAFVGSDEAVEEVALPLAQSGIAEEAQP